MAGNQQKICTEQMTILKKVCLNPCQLFCQKMIASVIAIIKEPDKLVLYILISFYPQNLAIKIYAAISIKQVKWQQNTQRSITSKGRRKTILFLAFQQIIIQETKKLNFFENNTRAGQAFAYELSYWKEKSKARYKIERNDQKRERLYFELDCRQIKGRYQHYENNEVNAIWNKSE